MEPKEEIKTEWKKLLSKPKLSKKDKENIATALKDMGISIYFPTNQPINKESLEKYLKMLDKAKK